MNESKRTVKRRTKKNIKCEEEKRGNEGDNSGSNRGKSPTPVKSSTRSKPKATGKGIKPDQLTPEKSDEIESKKTEDKQDKGQAPIPKVSNKKTGKKSNKVKRKSKAVRERVRIRTPEEHGEAMRFLKKRKYFSKTEADINKYSYMIKKLERTTEII